MDRLQKLDERVFGDRVRARGEGSPRWRGLFVAPLLLFALINTVYAVTRPAPTAPLETPCAQGMAVDVERILGVDVEISRSESGGDASWATRADDTVLQVTCTASSAEELSRVSTTILDSPTKLDGQPPAEVLASSDDFPTRLRLVHANAVVIIESAVLLDTDDARDLVDAWLASEAQLCNASPGTTTCR